MCWSSICRRYFGTLSFISKKEVAPFAMPKASHAMLIGNNEECAKNPPPTMKLFGLWSLKRKSSPGLRALNDCLPEGCQKLTSSMEGWLGRSWNQLRSVTPINAFITNTILLNCKAKTGNWRGVTISYRSSYGNAIIGHNGSARWDQHIEHQGIRISIFLFTKQLQQKQASFYIMNSF